MYALISMTFYSLFLEKNKSADGDFGRMMFGARFPQNLWSEAQQYFKSAS